MEVFRTWLSCSTCQRRAAATTQAVKAVVVKRVCPISGQAKLCPFPELCCNKEGFKVAPPKEPSKVDKVLRKGSELYITQQIAFAELSFEKAIELDPLDWRGHYSKAAALQEQGKPFKAFSACRRGLDKLPQDVRLLELQEITRESYKESKKAPAEPPPAQSAPACPGEAAAAGAPPVPVPRQFSGRLPTPEERRERRAQLLGIFREQWERIGKSKATMAYADYTPLQAQTLSIAGGHRPMARPDDVLLPQDFQKHVGVITSEELYNNFNCDCSRLIVSIHGDLFDVSDRPDKYGKNGPYFYFAGRDISWGLASGQDSENHVNMFFDFFKMEDEEIAKKLQCICSWIGFYEVEYGSNVGRLAEFESEHLLPAPPLHDSDPCVIQ